ncbi:MAG: 4-hydroxythreonine-4-phosphate dehydrogenase PdxA, partial [Thioalkalivibrio sp.]|nr:4-hydroxythreonine-4-phosphate dehydrogenase PdxA [Thioalkalivibrio sp.]
MRPRIAITPGDPRGIGPEVALAALRTLAGEGEFFEALLLGPEGTVLTPDPAHATMGDWLPVASLDDEGAGRIAAEAIEHGVALALAGDVEALVTAPIHKPSLHAAGRNFPGHTELLQKLAGAREVGMLMAAEETRLGAPLRVLLATTHIGLAEVPGKVTADLL